jgi:mannose-1-phosphate guanylyltransferase/phosphomannomutase
MKPTILVIAGGLATRLQGQLPDIPKCMLDICGKPLVQHQIEHFSGQGYDEFVFCVGHLANKVHEYFQNGAEFGVNVHYSHEPPDLLGTAGAVKLCEHLVDGTSIVHYGDNLASICLDDLVDFHRRKNSMLTIAARPRPAGYASTSIIALDESGMVKVFREKPSAEEFAKYSSEQTFINNGMYVINPDVFEHIPVGTKYDFAKQLIPDLLAKNLPVYCFVSNGFFRDVNSIEKYHKLLEEIGQKGRVFP